MGNDIPGRESVKRFTRLFGDALQLLKEKGSAEEANRLAAEGWSALRLDYPKEAEYLNSLLHRLTDAYGKAEDDAGEGDGAAGGSGERAPEDLPLDVRDLVPAERHELIIKTYEELTPGSAFILINDHDPKPLYYQFAFEYEGQFTWEPLEEGPEVWRVRIGKTEWA